MKTQLSTTTVCLTLGTLLIGVVAVVAIELVRPGQDNTQLILTLLGFLVPTVTSLLAVLRMGTVNKSVADIHHDLLANTELTTKTTTNTQELLKKQRKPKV